MLIGTPRDLRPALGWELQGLTRLLDLAAHRFLSVASATSSASDSVIPVNETSQTAKRFEKIDLQDQNPFRDFFLAKNRVRSVSEK